MELPLFTIFLFTGLLGLIDWWYFAQMRKKNLPHWIRYVHLIPFLLFVIGFIYIRYGLTNTDNFLVTTHISWLFIILPGIYLPKFISMIFYYLNSYLNRLFEIKTHALNIVGLVINAIILSIMFYSIFITREKLYSKEISIEYSELPQGFNNYKIAVFADMHLGSWNKRHGIMKKLIKEINAMDADIIIFAGDMVNNFHEEIDGWEPYFEQLIAKNGKYAVLGNHDYGDYNTWDSKEKKVQNFQTIKNKIEALGFQLLLNEHSKLIQNNDTLLLIGVENFGTGHMNSYSDLEMALYGSQPNLKKILISHDPNHWQEEITEQHPDIFLTISGHTHAGQIGLKMGRIHISPAKFIYPQWDGLYKYKNQYIYVNRGIGFVGVPTRVGVPPEVTLIRLKKQEH